MIKFLQKNVGDYPTAKTLREVLVIKASGKRLVWETDHLSRINTFSSAEDRVRPTNWHVKEYVISEYEIPYRCTGRCLIGIGGEYKGSYESFVLFIKLIAIKNLKSLN